MKVTLIFVVALTTMAAALALLLHAAPMPQPLAAVVNPPAIGTPFVMPSAIPLHTPSVVSATISIPDPLLIPNSVNLLRITGTSTQQSIVGVMHDDGKNGDIAAGDHTYTLQIDLTEPFTENIQFEVSAAFQGSLKRITTSPVTLVVNVDGVKPLPPDPGPAGLTSLNGTDADNDGVRDDVQRYIALTYLTSGKTQSALTQLAKAQLSLIADATSSSLTQLDMTALGYGLECLSASSTGSITSLLTALEDQILNTTARFKAYLQAEGRASTLQAPCILAPAPQTRCLLPPNAFPN